MKYKIVNYFPDRFQFYFKAAPTEEELEFAQILPMTILRITDVDTLKNAMHYVWYQNSRQHQLEQLDPGIEGYVREQLNVVWDFEPGGGPDPDAQMSQSDAGQTTAQTTATIV